MEYSSVSFGRNRNGLVTHHADIWIKFSLLDWSIMPGLLIALRWWTSPVFPIRWSNFFLGTS